MGEANNLARQRLTHFLAARLEARKRESNGSELAVTGPTIRSVAAESFQRSASPTDSSSSATNQNELKRDPII
jgi:hypothetical protein